MPIFIKSQISAPIFRSPIYRNNPIKQLEWSPIAVVVASIAVVYAPIEVIYAPVADVYASIA